jgi:drug/metabolite transporter (DMT)-like permease
MNQPIVYAIVAMVCYGFSDFIYKQAAAAGIRADHFLMAQGWFFCPLVILYALATHTLVLDPAALWGSLAGAFIFIGFYYFIRSLVAGSVSTNASIFRLNFIVTVFLVVALLGEPLTPSKIAGLAFALLATWLLVGAGVTADRTPNDARRRSLVQVAVATLAFGASNFFHTVGLRHGAVPETLAVAQAALFMPLATAVVYFADRNPRLSPVTFKYGAAAAVVLLGATIFLLRGVAGGQASVLVPIAQMGFIVAALLGIFILREPVTVRKAIGLVSALVALAVLAWNNVALWL